MIIIKSILVPTDLSDGSLQAVELARSFSVISNTRIYLVHVIEGSLPISASDSAESSGSKTSGAAASRRLNDFVQKRFPSDHDLVFLIRRGEICDEILRFAAEESVDLIVMATHGRTGLARAFMGSVAEKIVRFSPIPVLTIRSGCARNRGRFDANPDEKEHMR